MYGVPGSPRVFAPLPVRVIEVLGGDYRGECAPGKIDAAVAAGYAIVDLRDEKHPVSPRTAVPDGFRFEIGGEQLMVDCAEKFWNARKVFENENADNAICMNARASTDRFETKKRGRLIGWVPAGQVPIPRLYQRHDACAYLFAPAYAAQLEAIDPIVTIVLASRKIAVVDDPCSVATYGTSVADMLVAMLQDRARALDM